MKTAIPDSGMKSEAGKLWKYSNLKPVRKFWR
jgi:hypothetical protein